MVYEVTGWSTVPGDRIYAEADNPQHAILRAQQALIERDPNLDVANMPPVQYWKAEPQSEPFIVIVFQD